MRDPREAEVGEPGLARAEQGAAAADLEILLGELEAVRRGDHRLEPVVGTLRQLLLGAGDEQAERLLGPAPDAAAQLVQLGEPEPVRLLHDHDRRVRDVDADLDHRRRDEHVELPRLEAGHQVAPLGRLQPPVHAADAEALQLAGPQLLGLLLGGARCRRRRLLDQRADDVCLPALREVGAQARVRLGAALVGDPGGDDRLAARRRLRDLAHREVAVDRERERARDRRRGHVQDMRRAALDERRALLDAEAVLLVDDRDGEVAELEALLDQRVRADDDVRLPAHLRLDRAGDERAADAELHADPLDREEVLLGERLGRRHQRALAARLDRAQERVERDDRLARADVALEQALHRRRAREVGVDLCDRLLLVLGQLERERSAVALDQLAGRRQRRGDLLARARPFAARARAGARAARRRRAAAGPARPRRASAAGERRRARLLGAEARAPP